MAFRLWSHTTHEALPYSVAGLRGVGEQSQHVHRAANLNTPVKKRTETRISD